MDAWIWVVAYLIAINLWAYLAFYFDKEFAKNNKRRISENALLSIALAGGVTGAILAQQQFRHKTYKQPFKGLLYSIPFLHITIVAILLTDQGRDMLASLLQG